MVILCRAGANEHRMCIVGRMATSDALSSPGSASARRSVDSGEERVTPAGRWDFRSTRKIARVAPLSFDLSARASTYGLGYLVVEAREGSIPMEPRLRVLAPPVDGTLIDLSLVSQVREMRSPKRRIVGRGFLPMRPRAPAMNRFMARYQASDVRDDAVIRGRQRYVNIPRLCRSDGEITTFRSYRAQFYAAPGDRGGRPAGERGAG